MGKDTMFPETPEAVATPGKAASKRRIVVLSIQPRPGEGGKVEEKTFRLDKERVVIGSVVSADVRLPGDGISPIHAVLERAPGGKDAAVIYDLASDTGVFVNGVKAVTQELKDGDEITIGRHYMRFSLDDPGKYTSRERVKESEGRKLFYNPNEDFSPLLLADERDVQEIFDYRPTSKQALEVVMSWHGTILDIEHFTREKSVTVGPGRASDFGIPPILSANLFPIVTRNGEELLINLDAKMSGVMQRRGELRALDDLRATSMAGPRGHQIPIQRDDFAKIRVGEIDFYLSFTAAPPKLKRSRLIERDPFFLKVFIASMLLTSMTVARLLTLPVPQQIDAEQIPERIATILYAPEKYQFHNPTPPSTAKPVDATQANSKPKETPKTPNPKETVKIDLQHNPANDHKPVPKEMVIGKTNGAKQSKNSHKGGGPGQNEAKEGAGKRHKGTEGTRGSNKGFQDKQHQTSATRPSPNGGPGKGGAQSQVNGPGDVEVLKGLTGKIENILAGAGQQLGKSGERLKGFGGFDTRGNGGLALSGNGKGGGGTSELGQGLSDHGTGGGRVGTGMGAAGSGNGIIGGQARVSIRTGGPEEAVVMGAIDADAVERALLAHKDEFRYCYEKEVNAENPNLAGRVSTSFTIGSTGRVNQAGIESTTLKNASAERCILDVIRRIDFPIPRGAGIVQVTYPFKFSPVGH